MKEQPRCLSNGLRGGNSSVQVRSASCVKLSTNQEDVFELEDYFLHYPHHQRTAHRPCDQATGMKTKAEEVMHAAIVMIRQDACSHNSAQASDPVIAKVEK